MPRSAKKTKKSAAGVGTIRKKTVTRNGKEYTFWEARYTAGYDPGTGKQIQRSITGTDRIHGRRLETQQTKGGIPRMTPPNLTAWLLSLPPILYMIYRISVLSCSKAPWGLSV